MVDMVEGTCRGVLEEGGVAVIPREGREGSLGGET